MTPTTPDVGLFPVRQWIAAYADAVRHGPIAVRDYRSPQGEADLRLAIAGHFGRTRGIVADPDQVVVVQGTAQAIDLLLRVLKANGRARIGVEDPSHSTQHERIRALGLELIGCPVDRDGLITARLDCDAILVTPAHQFPTGCVLSGVRRQELLDWAIRRGRLIIEDDYDAEFRYDQEPIRALQGMAPDAVVYVGSTSKTLAPALRLGWIVAPGPLVKDLVEMKRLADDFTPAFDQLALATLIRNGSYDTHLRRARAAYRRRRMALISALAKHLPHLEVEGVAAGLHLLLRLPLRVDDAVVASEAREQGIVVRALSSYQVRSAGSGLVLGYGRLHESTSVTVVRALARILERHLLEPT